MSNTLINSSEPLLLIKEIPYVVKPDICLKWHTGLSISSVSNIFAKFNCDSEIVAESSFNDVIPRAKITKNEKMILYNTQVLFSLKHNITASDTVDVEVYICDGFPIDLAKEVLLTDALPLAIFMKFHRFFIHATCISIDGKHIAFFGDSGAGKSTLATFMYYNGYDVLSDDMICISVENGIVSTTSFINYLRLWEDSYKFFNDIQANATTYGGKHIIKMKEKCNGWVKVDACFWLNRGCSKTEIKALTALNGYIRLISSIIMGFAYENKEFGLICQAFKSFVKVCPLFMLNYPNDYSRLYELLPMLKEAIA
ncbi:MAG: hypothetical protein IJK34_04470 [Clostridia bacterium]|nr:hypothetical protein [Clostridia bacterium]